MLPSELVSSGAGVVVRAQACRAHLRLSPAEIRQRRPVRITASDAIVRFALLPRLGELAARAPGLTVVFRSAARCIDLSRVESDVAIRMEAPTEAALAARRFGVVHFGLYASEAYLTQHGTPRTPEDLARHALLGVAPLPSLAGPDRWASRLARDAIRSLDGAWLAEHLTACLAGRGIALLSSLAAGSDRRLVPVLGRVWPSPREAWIVTHQRARSNAAVGAVVAWMARDRARDPNRAATLAAVSSGTALE